MNARSFALARPASRFASRAALYASAPEAASIGALMLGPSANATPHQQIAHDGSAAIAARKERMASPWLNA